MCKHEGQECPGASCTCECMNCQFPEDDDYDDPNHPLNPPMHEPTYGPGWPE